VPDDDILGDADAARRWVESSPLPADQKALLERFVSRFPGITFSRDSEAELDEFAEDDQVTLPAWVRASRATLAGPEPRVRVHFDDFDITNPASDSIEDAWFEFDVGYDGREQRELFRDQAKLYRIGSRPGYDYPWLAAVLDDTDDERVHEFAVEDLMDDVYEGVPARDSVHPAFDTYASMLAHIDAVRLPDGTVIEAR
jgi:hypothetical protein